jgi:phosphoribosylformylglycinamidine synthase
MIGADVKFSTKSREDFVYFSESQSRIIVSISKNKKDEFEKFLKSSNQLFTELGIVGGSYLKINDDINVSLIELADLYFNSIPRIMSGEK